MSDLRDRIAAVMLAHSDESDSGPDCACGWDWDGYGLWKDAYAGHLADAVIAELGEQECPLCSHVYRLEEHN
jgi:hypothetical protein